MGSINDYLRGGGRAVADRPKKRRFGGRLMGQLSLSLILFLIVAASAGSDGIFGKGADYVMGDGISPESSWLKQQTDEPEDAVSVSAPAEQQVDVFPADDGSQPKFTAPASGVVVTDIAVASGGFTGSKGISIQGNAGQSVKAAADGSVLYLGADDDGYIIQLSHSGGFISVYQGISDLKVTAGQQVLAGDELGVTESGQLDFNLLLNDEEVEPMDYLFQ